MSKSSNHLECAGRRENKKKQDYHNDGQQEFTALNT